MNFSESNESNNLLADIDMFENSSSPLKPMQKAANKIKPHGYTPLKTNMRMEN